VRISNLADAVSAVSELGILYRELYKIAIKNAGLDTIELIDKFPVLSGHFGARS
jgi:hypothetical protein